MLLHNHESEKIVLGCLLSENDLVKKYVGRLKVEYFNDPYNRRIFEAINKAYMLHEFVDVATLHEFETSYLVELINSVVSTVAINHHIGIIMDLHFRKEIMQAGDKIRSVANDDSLGRVEEVKAEALACLSNVVVPELRNTKKSMADVIALSLQRLENAYNNNDIGYCKWNLNWLQHKTGGVKPEYTILAARPSVGKTAFALQMALGVAKQGCKVAIFSLETMADILGNRMICNHGNISKSLLDNPSRLQDDDWKKISYSATEISNLPITIYDDVYYIEDMILKIEELITEGLKFVVIDYLQLIETHKKTINANERVSHISRLIKKIQQQNNLHILALSQFSREAEKQTMPTLSNLRDSGSLEQDASSVWFLHVDNGNEYQQGQFIETQIIIAKQKEGERNIKKTLKFYGATQRFYDN